MTRIILMLVVLQFVFSFAASTTNAQNIGFAAGEIRYIKSIIQITTKKSFTLNGGTIWGVNHFLIDMPGDDVTVIYSESTLMAIAYISGTEKNVDFLGTTYDQSRNPNDILRYRTGRLSYIEVIDSSGMLIQLTDSTYWYVNPDHRDDVKNWDEGDRILLDSSENFILGLRSNEVASVVQAEVKFKEP